MALQALRNRIGEDAFWTVLRTWVSTRAGGNGSRRRLPRARGDRQRPGPRRLLRHLAAEHRPAGQDRGQRLHQLTAPELLLSGDQRRGGSREQARPSGQRLLAVGRGEREPDRVDAEPAQRLGLPPRRPVVDPGQPGELGVAAEDEVAQGAARRGWWWRPRRPRSRRPRPGRSTGRGRPRRTSPAARRADRPRRGSRGRRAAPGTGRRGSPGAVRTPSRRGRTTAGSGSPGGRAPRGRRTRSGRRRSAGRRR